MKKLIALLLISCVTSALGQSITPGGGGGGGGGGSGTVTSVATSCLADGGTITTSGTIFSAMIPRTVSAVNGPVLSSDCGKVVNFSQASNDAPVLPGPTDPGIFNGFFTNLCNISANSKTFTPSSGTIGGAASKTLVAASRGAPQCMWITADVPNNDWIISAGIVPASSTIVAGSTPTSGITSGNFMSSTGNLVVDSGVPVSSVVSTSAPNTFTNNNIFAAPQSATGAGAASTSSWLFSGIPFTGGSATTTFPGVLIQPSTATASTIWLTTGTAFGINAHVGTGNCLDIQQDGSSRLTIACASGSAIFAGSVTVNGATYAQSATGTIGWSARGFLSSPAAQVIQLGQAAAAAPLAQTLQAQGSRAGSDSNVGGGNFTITSGNGTGTGTLSSMLLQSPVAVGSGTGAQTQTTGLTIKGGTAILSAYTVSTLPASPTTGGQAYVTDAVACTFLSTVTGGGSAFCPVIWNGAAWQGG